MIDLELDASHPAGRRAGPFYRELDVQFPTNAGQLVIGDVPRGRPLPLLLVDSLHGDLHIQWNNINHSYVTD